MPAAQGVSIAVNVFAPRCHAIVSYLEVPLLYLGAPAAPPSPVEQVPQIILVKLLTQFLKAVLRPMHPAVPQV